MNFSKREILRYVGDTSQLFGVKDYCLNSGKAAGVRAVDVKTGSGLEFTVLPDRGLDIAWLTYKGTNLGYISKTGIAAPQFYDESGNNFLRNFYAGFLTTCGLRNVGPSCADEVENFGLHGRMSNIPGESVYSAVEWIDGQPVIKVKGVMREAKVFGENLTLTREITCTAGAKKILIEDAVENLGFREEPLMLLYHFNLGYPLLDEDSLLAIPSKKVTPRDGEAKKGVDLYNVFQKPTQGYMEQVFYHDLYCDNNGNTCVALFNERLNMGAALKYNKSQLLNLAQWKQMGEGEYVLGLEPCNCLVNGWCRQEARQRGQLQYLKAGEVRNFSIEVEMLDGKPEFERVVRDANCYR